MIPYCLFCVLVNYFVQRIFDDAFRARGFELRDYFTDDLLIYDRFDGHPALQAEVGTPLDYAETADFATTLPTFFSAMFIFKPTLTSASRAPRSSMAIVSIFWRFHLFFQAS